MLNNQTNQRFFSVISGLVLFITTFYGYENQIFTTIFSLFFVTFLINDKIVEKPIYWISLLACISPIFIFGWQFIGNQKFIHFYFIAALVLCSMFPKNRDDILKFSSFYLIILIFGVASLWKWLLPEFRSGDFLTFLTLSGRIFDFYAAIINSLFSSISLEESYQTVLKPNSEIIRQLQQSPIAQTQTLEFTPAVILLGKVMTYIALLTQSLIPLCLIIFLVTKKTIWMNIAHILLCEFIILAYYPTQVIGFGLLLCILGMVLAHYFIPKYKIVYMFLFALLIVFDLPLHHMALSGSISLINAY